MRKQIFMATVAASMFCLAALALSNLAHAGERAEVQMAFSPDGGAERLVLQTIDGAQRSIRVMAYSFTSPTVVRALIAAKRRGLDVAVTADYRSNLEEDRSGRAQAALGSLVYAGIPVRLVSVYPMQHSKYLVVDGVTVETGSFNFSQAARHNAENVIVVRGNEQLGDAYLKNWEAVSARGDRYRAP
ncbi:phospholipase D family protein [Burkholderia vietnamiensis]|uniref:phospholipase D family nuclease n=1 Tax=Burkholderia vietnamiensis TaxID=60552 RepID=UPI000759AF13|nr:phospholipase D family protein [Burkholderia vietnamiensis]KVR82523.1 endonuclease [Burkholderia vietnamiensis]MBR7917054.1 phospholipase D family protein [Burkholderia vietnamiensis]MDN8035866.1 phospholipase D family protein [Burkholderia vietnamiensis]